MNSISSHVRNAIKQATFKILLVYDHNMGVISTGPKAVEKIKFMTDSMKKSRCTDDIIVPKNKIHPCSSIRQDSPAGMSDQDA